VRVAHLAAGLLLVGALATACGDDAEDAPDEASKDDFCGVIEDAPIDEKPSQDDVDEWVDKLKDTGTPDDIPGDARHGYEVLVDALDDADVDDLQEDPTFEKAVKDAGDRADVQQFFVYYASKCQGVEAPSELPSGVPELPSGLPSDIPS
jgi:hypothetical protein